MGNLPRRGLINGAQRHRQDTPSSSVIGGARGGAYSTLLVNLKRRLNRASSVVTAHRVVLPKSIHVASLEKMSKVRHHISITSNVEMKNASDLGFGRRPIAKSDEFFISTLLVIEI